MNNDLQPTLDDLYPLPRGVKLHRYKLGARAASEIVSIRNGEDAADHERSPPEPLAIRWEDAGLQLKVLVRECADGRLLADVNCADPSLLDKAAVSVGLFGRVDDSSIQKLIILNMPATNGCCGSADFGPLDEAVAQLGPEIGIIVFMLV